MRVMGSGFVGKEEWMWRLIFGGTRCTTAVLARKTVLSAGAWISSGALAEHLW